MEYAKEELLDALSLTTVREIIAAKNVQTPDKGWKPVLRKPA
jgi:hypothetical protein